MILEGESVKAEKKSSNINFVKSPHIINENSKALLVYFSQVWPFTYLTNKPSVKRICSRFFSRDSFRLGYSLEKRFLGKEILLNTDALNRWLVSYWLDPEGKKLDIWMWRDSQRTSILKYNLCFKLWSHLHVDERSKTLLVSFSPVWPFISYRILRTSESTRFLPIGWLV